MKSFHCCNCTISVAAVALPDSFPALVLPHHSSLHPFHVQGKLGFKSAAVPLSAISDISTHRLKVDVSDLLERPNVQAQSVVAQQLLRLAQTTPAVSEGGD